MEGGLDLRDFCRAQAFEFFPRTHIDMAHVAEGAEFINNLARQINGTHALHARAQKDCQKL